MTAFLNDGFQEHESANVNIWLCEGCCCFHLRVGQILLTFTREEFADFTRAAIEANYGLQIETNVKDESMLPLKTELAA